MLTRRGFLGSLAALVALPKGWLTRAPLTTLGLSALPIAIDFNECTVTEALEKISRQLDSNVIRRRLYIDDDLRPIDVPAGATSYTHTDADVRGGYFTYPK